ncbi:uncharacterized protein LOC119099993 [Pollicipes pollicipes]|uniref:uncharacterized protein LOC119099993 n=1 Tax=Pollicipes pollicipes TaxID=41117 RepID=UPI001884A92E|nr:uncharacterized protein LOC119099993 [Pollicipes pollicipes]
MVLIMSPVPWCSSDEWQKLRALVCSIQEDSTNTAKLRLTISILRCLMSRLPSPPIGALMTSELLQAFLSVAGDTDVATRDGRSQMAFAIIRFVNYVSHAFQEPDKFGVLPLHKMAARQNVPDWLVTLRHDASHGALPPAHLLGCAMSAALRWVVAEYWTERDPAAEPEPEPEPGSGRVPSPEAAAVPLRRLEAMLRGSRGRHVSRTLLRTCLAGEPLRRPALQTIARAMVASVPQDKGEPMSAALLQSWLSTLTATSGTHIHQQSGNPHPPEDPASHIHQQNGTPHLPESDAGRPDGPVAAQGPNGCAWRHLPDLADQARHVDWDRLVRVALRRKNRTTSRVLPW